jgi:glutathione S-transferase
MGDSLPRRDLYGIRQSPWTERAVWALDHHHLSYHYHEHVPLLGELGLRVRAKKQKATVPLLVDGVTVFGDSFDIARHADRAGRGTTLFPRGSEDRVERFSELADRIVSVGRVRVLVALRRDPTTRRESVPELFPDIVRGALAPMSGLAARFLASKHRANDDVAGETARAMRPSLDTVRSALDRKSYLLGSFSFADVAIASALSAVRPRESAPLGPATRAAWTDEVLSREYEDLLMWRDAVYSKHRSTR